MDNCPVCENPISNPVPGLKGAFITCSICGKYWVTDFFLRKKPYKPRDAHIYSGALREHHENGNPYVLKNFSELKYSVSVPKSPVDQIDKLLLYINLRSNNSPELIKFTERDYSIAYAKNADELFFLIQKAWEMGLLDHAISPPAQARLSIPAGWQRIYELRESKIKSDQAFVAMNFHKSTNDIWEFGIKPALEFTGYQPLRIDQTETNNKIDDEIIAGIRKSGFMVADFTNHRPNVYYEAGFAMGLGKTVIRTCSEDQEKDLHFDTRQFSHILWSTPEDLKKKLINRIEATIPKPEK